MYVATTVLAGLLAGGPQVIQYAHATSHLGAHDRSGDYGAHLLFDGDPDTAWCEGAPGRGIGERIAVEFARPVRVDAVEIVPGDPIRFGGFRPANRPRLLKLSDMSMEWGVVLADEPGPVRAELPPPVEGRQIVFRIDAIHDHGARHTCLAEIRLYEEGRRLTLLPGSLGGPARLPIEGVWAPAGTAAPERFVVFYRDGRLRFRRDAPDPRAAPLDTWGAWRWAEPGRRLLVRRDDAETSVDVSARRSPAGQVLLELGGDLAGVWRPWVPNPGWPRAPGESSPESRPPAAPVDDGVG